jgi:hypothetical protein
MRQGRRLAGAGGIAFAATFAVGFTLFGPKSGHYSAEEVDRFLAQGAGALTASVCLFAIAGAGLIALMAYLSESGFGQGRRGRVTWATGLVATTTMLAGWALYLAPAGSVGSGGPAIDPGITYMFLNAGMGVLFGVGGFLLGLALLGLAVDGQALPTWLRAFSGLAGLSALTTWPFLMALNWSPNQWLPGPFYLVILWGLVVGIWLLVTSPGLGMADD